MAQILNVIMVFVLVYLNIKVILIEGVDLSVCLVPTVLGTKPVLETNVSILAQVLVDKMQNALL